MPYGEVPAQKIVSAQVFLRSQQRMERIEVVSNVHLRKLAHAISHTKQRYIRLIQRVRTVYLMFGSTASIVVAVDLSDQSIPTAVSLPLTIITVLLYVSMCVKIGIDAKNG